MFNAAVMNMLGGNQSAGLEDDDKTINLKGFDDYSEKMDITAIGSSISDTSSTSESEEPSGPPSTPGFELILLISSIIVLRIRRNKLE